MIKRVALVLILILNINFISNCQPTDEFFSIDEKHAFNDVVFGTTYSLLKTKMGLEQTDDESTSIEHGITNEKYLSIGSYHAEAGRAYFTKNKLQKVVFHFYDQSTSFDEIMTYFNLTYGGAYHDPYGVSRWSGKNVSINILYSKTVNSTLVSISSNKIKHDSDSDIF